MSSLAIRASEIGKRYRKGAHTRGTLLEWLRGRSRYELFWALKEISFEVQWGEMLGVIGPNGAGKSTLLRILSRITRPTEGWADIGGKVGSLLDVGTGFHPELTGRENIQLNGSLIGMHRSEIRKKFDEIVEYSGIGEFLDTPLKRYSSGMKVRLGFAVAINLQQEIMLVDEVLAVGDAAFREKCLDRMEEATSQGRTVLFVGHNMDMISASCDRAIWIDKGTLRAAGPAPEIVQAYQDSAFEARAANGGFISLAGVGDPRERDEIALTHVRLLGANGAQVSAFRSGQRVKLAIGYRLGDGARPADVSVGLAIIGRGQSTVAFCESSCVGTKFADLPAEGEFVCEFDKLALMPGYYKLALDCRVGPRRVLHIPNAGRFSVLEGDFYHTGVMPPSGSGSSLLEYRWTLDGPKGEG